MERGQERRSQTWEGHDTLRALFYEAKGAIPEHKKGTTLFIAKSWRHVPPVPPGSYVSVHSLVLLQGRYQLLLPVGET